MNPITGIYFEYIEMKGIFKTYGFKYTSTPSSPHIERRSNLSFHSKYETEHKELGYSKKHLKTPQQDRFAYSVLTLIEFMQG